MRSILFSSIVAAFALPTVLLARSADATSVGGWAGKRSASSFEAEIPTPCFAETWGGVKYPTGGSGTCASSHYWEVALHVGSGSHTAIIEAGWPSGSSASSYISCQTNALPQDGDSSSGSFSGWSSPSGTTGTGSVSQSVTVATSGYLFVNCEMSPGSTLYSVNY